MMPVGTKRKRPDLQGLPAGERLKRDKLAGAEYSQWGWVPKISELSQITHEHRLTACGFRDRLEKPLCPNKYAGLEERDRKRRKVDAQPKPVNGEDADDVIVISSEDEGPVLCTKRRCKENPQCVNYLGQIKLEKEDDALEAFLESRLGPSPLDNAREPDLPIGLKNLGATCYANAFIQECFLVLDFYSPQAYLPSYVQVWFQDLAFRDGVYKCKHSQDEDKDIEDSPIFQLQVTFAALQESTQNVFNPVKLVESLQLRASEQQDAQEFSKLFMSHLATEFAKQAVPSLKTLISDQFEGKQTYGTMCKNCRHRSERDMNFLELEINLENGGKLEERIEALLQSEELTDDNRYYCARCDGLQDATRYTKLRRLPPVLHFSVLRFVFDLSTLSRKKSKQAIIFPRSLDMSPFVDPAAPENSNLAQIPSKRPHEDSVGRGVQSDSIYELRGVLLHKGPSAYHGHYEAQVFDVTTRQFYQFNDETVTPIASLQAKKGFPNGDKGFGSDRVSAVANKRRRTYTRKKVRVDDSDAETEKRPNTGKRDNEPSYISSKDAYMLIYARRDRPPGPQIPEPPPAARERVVNLNRSHDEACASYLEREKHLITAFNRMFQNKADIYRRWEIGDWREESAVVSRKALEDWLIKDIEKPRKPELSKEGSNEPSSLRSRPSSKPNVTGLDQGDRARSSSCDPLNLIAPSVASDGHRLDNSAIVCRHGALDPSKAGDMKRIKKDSAAAIFADTGYRFDPELSTADICKYCFNDMFIDKRYALEHPIQVARFDELCAAENGTRGAFVPRQWFRDWRQTRPKMYVTGKGDLPPDAPEYAGHVKCGHGQLSLVSASRKQINGEARDFLQSIFPSWVPIPDDTLTCEACDEELHISKETKQEMKKQIEHEKIKLRNIISLNILAMNTEIVPGLTQAVVPSDFVRQWRNWVSRPHEKSRPGPVDNTRFLCEHDRLIFDPNSSKDVATCISLVTLSDWDILQELYGGGPLIALTTNPQDSQGSEPVSTVAHEFEVCHECRRKRLSDFETATITIRILGDDEPNPTPDCHEGLQNMDVLPKVNGTSSSNSKRGRNDARAVRTSHRLRNSKHKVGRRDITIGRSWTVRDIKVELQDKFDIPTICQRLFFRGKELLANSDTTASLGIMADDTLELREEKENDEELNSDAELERKRERRDEGRAFGGTVLSGSLKKPDPQAPEETADLRQSSPEATPCPACTFINPDGLVYCTICDSKLNA